MMLSSPLCPRYFRLLHHTITGAALARNRCTAFTQTQKYKIHKYIHTIYRRPEFARGRCTSFTLLLTSHCTSHTFPPFRQFPTSMTALSFEAGVRKISSPTYSEDKHKAVPPYYTKQIVPKSHFCWMLLNIALFGGEMRLNRVCSW